jgi:hypothetical protein
MVDERMCSMADGVGTWEREPRRDGSGTGIGERGGKKIEPNGVQVRVISGMIV